MKKLIAGILIIVMFCSIGGISAFAVTDFTQQKEYSCGEFKYRVLDDGTAAITGLSSKDGMHISYLKDIEIPATVDEYPVTVIAENAFFDNDYIHSVVIPDGVVRIEEYAFMHCGTIKSVKLPDTLRVIERGAFLWCGYLEEINFPKGLLVIEESAFKSCKKIKKLNVPDTVVEIGDHAFAHTGIIGSEFSLPDNLQKLGEHILDRANCDTKYSDIWYDGAIYVNNYLISVDEKTKGEFVVRDDTKLIADGAFRDCKELTKIVIPEGITDLGHSTFYGCELLTDVILPDTLNEIGKSFFWGCTSLEEIKLPSGITELDSSAFNSCINLKKITLPESLKVIDPWAFKNCTSLTSVVIPEGVETISLHAFLDCDNLKTITIPDTVTSIDECALGYYTVESGFDFDFKIEYFPYEDVVIRGYADSFAQKYANSNDLRFEELLRETVLGDVDADSEITIKDATLVQKYVACITSLYNSQKNYADVESDGAVNIKDATAIQKMIAGIE